MSSRSSSGAQFASAAVAGDPQGECLVVARGRCRAAGVASRSAAGSVKRRRTCPPGMSRLSSAGGALGGERPLSRTAIRSASWSASSRYWVVRKTVTPPATSSRMICHMLWRERGSQAGGRLVQEDDLGLPDQRHGQVQAPPHAAGVGGGGLLGRPRRGRTAPAVRAARRALALGQVVQVGHQEQVLLAGEQVVHRGELAGYPDRGADLVRAPGSGHDRRRAPRRGRR